MALATHQNSKVILQMISWWSLKPFNISHGISWYQQVYYCCLCQHTHSCTALCVSGIMLHTPCILLLGQSRGQCRPAYFLLHMHTVTPGLSWSSCSHTGLFIPHTYQPNKMFIYLLDCFFTWCWSFILLYLEFSSLFHIHCFGFAFEFGWIQTEILTSV